MSDFAKIGELVTKGQQLLDSIKGGAIRTMQTQFDELKKQLNDKLTAISGELNTFVMEQKNNVNSIFADPDKRYQKLVPQTFTINGDKDKFYPVVIGSVHVNRLTNIHIGRDGSGGMYSRFTVASRGWGTRPTTLRLEELKTNPATIDEDYINVDGFIADYAVTHAHPVGFVVYLRGGYEYEFWCEGAPLNQVVFTKDQTAQPPSDGIIVYEGGYSRNYQNVLVVLPIKTARNEVTVPNFKTYERI